MVVVASSIGQKDCLEDQQDYYSTDWVVVVVVVVILRMDDDDLDVGDDPVVVSGCLLLTIKLCFDLVTK